MNKNETNLTTAQNLRLEHWLTQLEEQTHLLLEDIDLEELSSKDRVSLALKMLSQIQHFLTIQQKSAAPAVSAANNQVNILLQDLRRRMRGEDELLPSQANDLSCVDEDLSRLDEDLVDYPDWPVRDFEYDFADDDSADDI